jgi:hypothetical protein
MTEENKDITTTGSDVDEGDESQDQEEELTIEEEFRTLWGDAQTMQARFMKLAAQADEEKDPTSAKILRSIGGDLMPLISDVIAASGSAFEEVGEVADEAHSGGVDLTDDELVQIYVTLASNERAFSQLIDMTQDENAKAGLQQLLGLNQSALSMLKENFGEDLVNAAQDKLQEASGISS